MHKLIAPLACIAKAATTIELPSLAGALGLIPIPAIGFILIPTIHSIAKDLSYVEFTIEGMKS